MTSPNMRLGIHWTFGVVLICILVCVFVVPISLFDSSPGNQTATLAVHPTESETRPFVPPSTTTPLPTAITPPATKTLATTEFPGAAGTSVPVCALMHTVQFGESLASIGQQYGVDWQHIARINNVANPRLIHAGQVLCIPPLATPTLPVRVRKPAIENFRADRELVTLGESVTLTWKSDAVSAQLCNPYKLLNSICLPVATSGSTVISVVNARRNNDVQQFSLVVGSGPSITGEIESRELIITIKCPGMWFFANPPDECARPAVQSSAIAQRFERGWMIELQEQKRILILFEDSSQGNPYNEIQDTWQPGMAETDPTILPLSGMYQPKRGLGVAWRSLDRKYCEMLRWATQPEFMYDAVLQCNAGLGDVYARCYLLGPSKRVIILGRGTFYQWSILTH